MTVTILATSVAPWIPVAHTMTVVRGDRVPTPELITAAFVYALDSEGRLLLTHVNLPGRGWDVPGGHVDAGETPAASAARELAEETGLELSGDRLTILGWQSFLLEETPPAWYHYPFPLSYTLAFWARLDVPSPPVAAAATSECGPVEWCTRSDVQARCGTTSWFPLYQALMGAQCSEESRGAGTGGQDDAAHLGST